jgi:hypothetical protein
MLVLHMLGKLGMQHACTVVVACSEFRCSYFTLASTIEVGVLFAYRRQI